MGPKVNHYESNRQNWNLCFVTVETRPTKHGPSTYYTNYYQTNLPPNSLAFFFFTILFRSPLFIQSMIRIVVVMETPIVAAENSEV